MGRQISWDEVPDRRRTLAMPATYLFEIEAITEGETAAGALSYKGAYRVAEGPFEGTVLYEFHNIGSKDDPQAKDPLTWKESIGTRTLKELFRACGLPLQRDLELMMKAAEKQRFVADVVEEGEKRRDGSDNPRKGYERIIRKYRVGERVADHGVKTGATPTAPAAATDGAGAPPPGTIKSPFTGAFIPAGEFAAHIREHGKGTA